MNNPNYDTAKKTIDKLYQYTTDIACDIFTHFSIFFQCLVSEASMYVYVCREFTSMALLLGALRYYY